MRKLGLDVCSTDDGEDDTSKTDIRAFLTSRLSQTTHLLSTVGTGSAGDPILRDYDAELKGMNSLAWLAYLSSTSVYGEHDGGWVTEATTPADARSVGIERLEAEQGWAAIASSLSTANAHRLCIMRLAGIYGPGRSAIDTLLRRPVFDRAGGAGAKLTSRVHVDDIVAALIAAAGHASASGVYNIGDNLPASRDEVFAYARGLLQNGKAGPACAARLSQLENAALPVGDLQPAISRRQRERTSKRVSNQRLCIDLLPKLAYPSFREGLDAIASSYAASDVL
jgi:nucleoside-diphosphate-sugar epimerase